MCDNYNTTIQHSDGYTLSASLMHTTFCSGTKHRHKNFNNKYMNCTQRCISVTMSQTLHIWSVNAKRTECIKGVHYTACRWLQMDELMVLHFHPEKHEGEERCCPCMLCSFSNDLPVTSPPGNQAPPIEQSQSSSSSSSSLLLIFSSCPCHFN